ncbi:MAG: methyltransferase domain-containing protein [Chloroflexi bacterium]|nr:methyltransferase domain-containing protein [Chloroflexota bacterium]
MAEYADPRAIYGSVAELYDEVRPGYPDALIADVIRLSGIPETGRMLEIGCGPGKATIQLAPSGRRILCIEPVPEMIDVARRRCAGFPNVRFARSTFEDFNASDELFDLVVSAQAFHWVRPEIGFRKAGQLLKPGGSIALFWSENRIADGRLQQSLDDAYRRLARGMHAPHPGRGSWSGRIAERISETGLFDPVTTRRYPWTIEFDTDRWIKLQKTSSDHRTLPQAQLDALLAEVRRTIDERGGKLKLSVETVVFLARRQGNRASS